MSKLKTINSGTRFGSWVVIEYAGRKGHNSFWKCQCDCGKISAINGHSLRAGTSSKCLSCKMKFLQSKENIEKRTRTIHAKRPKGAAAFIAVWGNYKRSAHKNNRIFTLTETQFKHFILSDCHYCGQAPSNVSKPFNEAMGVLVYSGVDRKDNSLGYTLDNCVPCCAICNKTKRNMSYQEFKSWIVKVFNHFGGK
jgi:hypothetical protein